MALVKIGDQKYETEYMSKDAKEHLISIQFANKEIERLQALLSLAKTARNAYVKALTLSLQSYSKTSETLN